MSASRRKSSKASKPPSRPKAAALAPAAVFEARDWPALAASVLAPLLLYAFTLPRTVVLEDDGLFLMAGEHFGVAHPPGYPLYTLIIHLFMQLAAVGASKAFFGHLSSAFLGALACGGVYACARLLQTSPVVAVTAAWLFAASEHFWAQAIIAEVYTLNALLFFAAYALILYGVRRPQQGRVWFAAAAVYGLSLANHWPLMVLSFPGLAVAAWPAWPTLRRRLAPLAAVAVAAAAVPYLWMVLRSLQEPLISFYGPIDSWEALVEYIGREDYAGVDVSPSAGWRDRLAYLGWFGSQIVWQLTLPGFVMALTGLQVLLRSRRFTEAGSSLLVFSGTSLVLVALLAFDFDPFNIAVFRPYSLVCYGLVALWLAIGFQYILERWPFVPLPARAPWLKTTVAVLAGVAMTAASVHARWPVNDRSGSRFAERYADTVLSLVPKDAVLLVYGDTDSASLGYYRFVENRRPDIELINVQGILYGNRLYPPNLARRKKEEKLRAFVSTIDRPVFLTTNAADREIFTNSAIRHYGFVQEVMRGGDPGTIQLQVSAGASEYFESLIDTHPKDAWERYLRNLLLAHYGDYLGYALSSNDPDLAAQVEPMVALAETSFYSIVGMSEVLMQYGKTPAHRERLTGYLEKAESMRDQALTKNLRSRLLYLKGFLYAGQERREEAIALFRQSYRAYPHPENGALDALKQWGVSVEP